MSYLPCELHCHTVHSDGKFLPSELQSAARENGLELIALTDHNTTSGYDEMKGSLPFIRGIEWTTYFGHMLVLGANSFVDWRNATPDNIDEKLEEVKASGGITGIAHPFQLGSPFCTGGRWEFKVKCWDLVDYIEIWHEGFSPDSLENSRSLELWTSLLDSGYRLAATYGRDWHAPDDNAHYCCTYLGFDEKVSESAALKAIKNGRSVVSTGARFFFKLYQNEKSFDIGDTLEPGKAKISFFTDEYARRRKSADFQLIHKKIKLITNGGKTVLESSLTEKESKITLEENHWYRAELWGSFNGKNALLAVTSPVYVKSFS